MERLLLDTSIIVKWYHEEENTDIARLILEKHKQRIVSIIVPDILGLELANALKFGIKFPDQIVKESISSFYALDLSFIPLTRKIIEGAVQLITELSITSYDAVFLYLAQSEKIPLITADRKHHQKKYSKRIKYLDEF